MLESNSDTNTILSSLNTLQEVGPSIGLIPGILGFPTPESVLIANSSACRALKIIRIDIKIGTIP